MPLPGKLVAIAKAEGQSCGYMRNHVLPAIRAAADGLIHRPAGVVALISHNGRDRGLNWFISCLIVLVLTEGRRRASNSDARGKQERGLAACGRATHAPAQVEEVQHRRDYNAAAGPGERWG